MHYDLFFLFFCLSFSENIKNIFNNKIYVLGIWAGKETILTRVKYQAQTWMKFWDEVLVFSDKFYNGTCKKIQKIAYPCSVKCISLGDFAHHLDGTEWTHRWYFAQPRFLPAMSESYFHNPNADFYIFGDDDTFFLKPGLIQKFGSRNSSIPLAAGKVYCAWNRISDEVKPYRTCHPFLQGGAGVLITNGLMSQIASELPNCSKRFNDPDFAGSMRFAICMERLFGTNKWSENEYIESWLLGFHSSPPKEEIKSGLVIEASATFHRMNYSDYLWIHPKIYVDWKSPLISFQNMNLYSNLSNITLNERNNNQVLNELKWHNKKLSKQIFEYRADLSLYAFIEYNVPIMKNSYICIWKIGMWICPKFGLNAGQKIKPKGGWKVIFGENGTIEGYEQRFRNGFRMRVIPDNHVIPGALIPRDISGNDGIFSYGIYPPEIRRISH